MSGVEEERASTATSKGDEDDIHHMMAEVAAAASGPSAAVPSELVMGAAYADNISPAAIQEVLNAVGLGLSNFSRIRNFIANTADSYKQAHDNVNKLLSQELLAGTGADSMASFWAGWGTLLQQIQLVNRQVATMHKAIREVILNPMAKFLDSERRKYEIVKNKIDVYTSTTAKLEKALEKSKAKCLKLIKTSSDQEAASSKSTSRLALGSTLTAALGGGWTKALEASAEYEQQIEEVNTFYRAFHEREVPKAFSALQKIEESRGQLFATVLEQFSAIFQGFQAEVLKVSPELATISSHVDVSHDIEHFINKISMRFGSVSSITARTYFTYDLPLSLRELELKSLSKTKKFPIDLNGTPDQIVAEQRRLFPDWSYRVPRIFLLLKRAVEDLGGLEREGIFRVSADYALVEAVYSKLQAAIYDVEIDNPHVAANCLKKWLRELSSPLIPISSQGPIIAALDRASNATSAGQADSLNTAAEAVVKSVYDSLPPATKLTIQGLVRLLRDISYPENAVRTKMGLSNLAIVFGPSFLRPPEDFKDASLAVKAADRAGQLVMHLVHVVDVRDYPLEEEYAAASPLIRLVAPRERWRHAPLTLDGLESKAPSSGPLDAKDTGRIGSAPPVLPAFVSGPGSSGVFTGSALGGPSPGVPVVRAAGSSPVVLPGAPAATPGIISSAPLPARPLAAAPSTAASFATSPPLPARPIVSTPGTTSSFPPLSVAPPGTASAAKPPLPSRPSPATGKPPLPAIPPSTGAATSSSSGATVAPIPGFGPFPPGGLKIVHPGSTSPAIGETAPSARTPVSLPSLPTFPSSDAGLRSSDTTASPFGGLGSLPSLPVGGLKIVHPTTPLVATDSASSSRSAVSLPVLPPVTSETDSKATEMHEEIRRSELPVHEMPVEEVARTSRPRGIPPPELIVSISSREAQEAERGSTPHDPKSPIAGLKMVGTQSDAIVAELAKRAGRGGLKSAPGLQKSLELGEERVIDTVSPLSPRTLEATQIGPPTPSGGDAAPLLSPSGKPLGGVAIPILTGGVPSGFPALRHVDREADHSHDHDHDHGDGDIDPDEFKDKVNEKFSVKSLKEKFGAEKGKERRLSYVKRCPNCHSRVTNDKICYECYAKLDKPAEKPSS